MQTASLENLESPAVRTAVVGGSALILSAICAVDASLDPDVTLDILYILPLIAVALFASRGVAIVFSLLSGIGWYIAQTISAARSDFSTVRVWNAVMLFGIFLTVTLMMGELRRLQRQLAQQRQQLLLLNELKDESLSTYSHDIRGLLTSVVASCYVLLKQHRGPVNAAQREILDRTLRSTRSILELVNTLLELTRIESGQETLKCEPLNLRDVLHDSLTAHQSLADQRGIRLLLKVEPTRLDMDGDRTKLMRIVNNLVSNAIKFSPEHGDIAIHAISDSAFVCLSITDQGPGIAPEDQRILFDRFGRLSKPAHAQGEGSGLGLSITRALVRLHGGEISVASEVGQGATFTVRLPLRAGNFA